MHVEIKECKYNSFGMTNKYTRLNVAQRVAIHAYVETLDFTLRCSFRFWWYVIELKIWLISVSKLSYTEYLEDIQGKSS